MRQRIDIPSRAIPGRPPWAACGLLVVATLWALPAARAADTSAAAAAALKVLSTPLNGADSNAAPAGNASTSLSPAGPLITVQKGESIDAVLRRGLPGMPFKEEFMRQALAQANPKIFPKGRTYPVRPGTVLALPSVPALRQQLSAQYPQAATLFQASAVKEDDQGTNPGPDKRRWVRFP